MQGLRRNIISNPYTQFCSNHLVSPGCPNSLANWVIYLHHLPEKGSDSRAWFLFGLICSLHSYLGWTGCGCGRGETRLFGSIWFKAQSKAFPLCYPSIQTLPLVKMLTLSELCFFPRIYGVLIGESEVSRLHKDKRKFLSWFPYS